MTDDIRVIVRDETTGELVTVDRGQEQGRRVVAVVLSEPDSADLIAVEGFLRP